MSDEIQRSLGRVEGKLDTFLDAINKHFQDDQINFGNIDKRISKIEKKVYWFSGAWAAVGAIVAFILKH